MKKSHKSTTRRKSLNRKIRTLKKVQRYLLKRKYPRYLYVIGLAVILAVIGLGYFMGKPNFNNTASKSMPGNPATQWSTESLYASLPDCEGKEILNQLPVDDSKYNLYSPMGQISPADGQIVPNAYTSYIWSGPVPASLSIKSPIDGYITKIHDVTTGAAGQMLDDVSISFMVCKQVVFTISHIDKLDTSIAKSYLNTKLKTCTMIGLSSANARQDCYYLTEYPVSTGDAIGSVSLTAQKRGFSFGAIDSRTQPAAFINPARYQVSSLHNLDVLHSVCPYDYLPAIILQKVFSSANLAGLPPSWHCGQVSQDKAGTIQGNWFADSNSASNTVPVSKQLSIVHYANRPSVAEISVGGTIAKTAGTMAYTPEASASTNVDPALTAIGRMYCFSANGNDGGQNMATFSGGHHILIQLINASQIKAEYKPTAGCGRAEQFSNPTTYYR